MSAHPADHDHVGAHDNAAANKIEVSASDHVSAPRRRQGAHGQQRSGERMRSAVVWPPGVGVLQVANTRYKSRV